MPLIPLNEDEISGLQVLAAKNLLRPEAKATVQILMGIAALLAEQTKVLASIDASLKAANAPSMIMHKADVKETPPKEKISERAQLSSR